MLGSTVALTDETGQVKTRYVYDAFGGTTTLGEANANPAQFTGRDNDATGLYYYRARYYSPTLHRFISEDPIGLTGGINGYAYVGNSPTNATDPTGMLAPTPDMALDFRFIAYDVYELATGGRKNLGTNMVALGLDVLGAALPFVTGLGAAYRGTKLASKLDDVTKFSKVEHVSDFDAARKMAFERAGLTDPNLVEFSKVDPVTGTVVEFKGPGGSKVAYDAPHLDIDPLAGHDLPHIGWQTAGKRGQAGFGKGNITYSGPQHPFRP